MLTNQLAEDEFPAGAIAKVLTQNSYKQRAIAFQEVIVRSGGVKKAADIIEQVISTGRPVFAQNSY